MTIKRFVPAAAALAIGLAMSASAQAQMSQTFTDQNGDVYTYGYDQATKINQNTFIERRDKTGRYIWRVVHANGTPDERTILMTLNKKTDELWAVWTTDGGNSNFATNFVTGKPFDNVFLGSYGRGGGPKVSVLGKIDKATGKLLKATFLTARLADGKTNSSFIRGVTFDAANNVVVIVNSYYRPPGKGATEADWKALPDSQLIPHKQGGNAVRITFDPTLKTVLKSEMLPATFVYPEVPRDASKL